MVLEKTPERYLDSREIKQVNPEENQSSVFTGGTDAKAETPLLWPPMQWADLQSLEGHVRNGPYPRQQGQSGLKFMVWEFQLLIINQAWIGHNVIFKRQVVLILGLPRWLSNKESACQCKRCRRTWFDPWVGRFPGVGNGNPLQYSCLENSMDRGAWQAIVHGAAKSWTQLRARACTHAHTHTNI